MRMNNIFKSIIKEWGFYLFFIAYSVSLVFAVKVTAERNQFVITCSEMGYVPLVNGTCMSQDEYDTRLSMVEKTTPEYDLSSYLNMSGDMIG